jgi:hypothetical protein
LIAVVATRGAHPETILRRDWHHEDAAADKLREAPGFGRGLFVVK